MLHVEMQRLKRELSTTGAPATTVGGSTLERLDTLEAALTALTGKTEELEHRINRIVQDGTNRIGDLEFRLVELEGGDISKLGQTTTLGGDQGLAPAPEPAPQAPAAEMAMGEQADFDTALAAFNGGDFRAAAAQFATFNEIYPGGPLTADAHYYRGEALRELGDHAPSARAYLESFSAAPDGTRAPDALFKLGVALSDLGQTQEACVTLAEVGFRFPGAPAVAQADAARASLGCN